MKIILSGGWGYGNMGDDAILLASINLLRNKFPESQIVILTSNVLDTKSLIYDKSIIVYEDLYNKMFEDKYAVIVQSVSYRMKLKKLLCRIFRLNNRKKKILANKYLKNIECFTNKHRKSINSLNEIFSHADLYVMSGGGYLNCWVEMGIVKHIECLIAKKNCLRMYSIGQTIGPFENMKSAKALVMDICKMMDGVFFRDNESIKDCEVSNKILNRRVPDIALYDIPNTEKSISKDSIVFIPYILSDFNNIVRNLSKDFKRIQHQNNIKVVVTITQSWKDSIDLATLYYLYLKQNGLDVELNIPNNVFELQGVLSKARCVISQNLHGLILAYRLKCPIISLNMHRKFIGFMSEISCKDLLLNPSDLSANQLYETFLITQQRSFNKQQILKEKIVCAWDSMLIDVKKGGG